MAGATNLGNNLFVAGTSTLTGAVTTGSTLAVAGATTLSSTLAVGGVTNLNNALNVAGNVAVATNKFTINAATGAYLLVLCLMGRNHSFIPSS